MEQVYDEYLERRNFLLNELNKIPGVYSPTPMGAFYTMVQLPVDDAERFCQWCLTDFQYEGQTVMMAPGAGFYTHPEDGRNQVRMAYTLCCEDLAKAMVVLAKALEAYNSEETK
jgi:aspartate aminotransferase